MTTFASMELLDEIKQALAQKGYTKPTPIQAQCIPLLLKGRDVLGVAQTGTGKTAAFALPIIHTLRVTKVKRRPGHVRALILTPTRELATQIDRNIKGYGKGLGLISSVIFGGVSTRPQRVAIGKGMDILVATPGRLIDLMSEGIISYDALEFFVLDEADRMLDLGFIRDVRKIIQELPKKKQTLLFSATMPKDIATLAKGLLKNPEHVEVTPQATTVERINQQLFKVVKANKPKLLLHLLKDENIKSALVFTRTKYGADRVVKGLLKEDVEAAAIHSNKSQNNREKALGQFRVGKVKVLVATDIAARGIDIDHVELVINYELPDDSKSYVHRIGRTARAGRQGKAISFCDDAETKQLKSIERLIKQKIPLCEDHPYHGKPAIIKNQNNSRRQGKKVRRGVGSRS